MATDNRWQGQLVRDRHGEPVAIVAVRIGPTWTDTVAIEGEDRTTAVRTRTHDDGLILPTDLPDGPGAVWRRDAPHRRRPRRAARTPGGTAPMTATTIRVRVNPAASDEYVIYADPADTDGQHWLLLGPDGQYDGWEYDEHVADWTEFELRIPPLTGQSADPARSLPGGPVRC